MKPGLYQCLEILSNFLLIFEHIDQEHVTCVFNQDQHLGHVASMLPILDETQCWKILPTFLQILEHIDQ